MRNATGHRSLRCLADQRIGSKLVTTGAVQLERATPPQPRPPLTSAHLVVVTVLIVACLSGCHPRSE